MALHKRPSFAEFVVSVVRSWGENMSGAFQVFFTLLALAVFGIAGYFTIVAQQTEIRVTVGALGILALLLAFYKVWEKERNEVCNLESPNLGLTFDPSHSAFVHATHWNPNDVLVIHVLPTCNAPIDGVEGYLKGIDKLDANGKWQQTEFNEPIPLSWSYPNVSGPLSLHPNLPKYLNLLFVFDGGGMIPGTMGLAIPKRMAKVLNRQETFRLNVCVTGNKNAFAELFIKMRIGENWNEPEVLELCSG